MSFEVLVSLIPYGGVARLLEDVLPVAYTQNGMTIRNHVLETAERIETDLGEEKPVRQPLHSPEVGQPGSRRRRLAE